MGGAPGTRDNPHTGPSLPLKGPGNLYPTDTATLPSAGHAEIRIVAATPEVARTVAELLRHAFAGTEQRSYPIPDGGTRLHLTVDTEAAAAPALAWLITSRPSSRTGAYDDEV